MPAPGKYPDELRDRAQRLVAEAMSEDTSLSLNAAVKRIAPKVGVVPDTLRGWVRRAEIDEGRRPGTTSTDAASIKALQAEVRELKRANEILLAAFVFLRAGARPATAVVSAFIDAHHKRFGVVPICRVLTEHGCPIAPSTYYAARARGLSARAMRDELVPDEVCRVHKASRGGLYGARKIYHQLCREGVTVHGSPVARCTIERLMKTAGMQGVRRDRRVRTTIADDAAIRPADPVKRDFTATRPNELWVVDFTYVATFAGFVYVAFAIDVFSRMIVGWRAASSMKTDLPLDALDMALWSRRRAGRDVTGLVHHSDAGSQYTSIRYTDRLIEAGLHASIGTVGDSYDNALAESVNGLYKAELVYWEGPWRGRDDLELATLGWVDWFNYTGLHSSLAYQTPAEIEAEYYRHNHADEHPLPAELTV
ncbi:IS3 family transposase [Janibacter limosus]|uniref:IS3 family transposase n=2 Tax=Janibacter limosus TaxID=53458 RepID=A0AC61U3X2_9MICO|nr:IS3 family transposase [Janibacter limosus]WKV16052.1 IS3 family transposase [Janibacter limosus]